MEDLSSYLCPPSPLPCTDNCAETFEGCKYEISSSSCFLYAFSFALLVILLTRDGAPLLQLLAGLWCPQGLLRKRIAQPIPTHFQTTQFCWEGDSCCRNRYFEGIIIPYWAEGRHFHYKDCSLCCTRDEQGLYNLCHQCNASAIKPGVFEEKPGK